MEGNRVDGLRPGARWFCHHGRDPGPRQRLRPGAHPLRHGPARRGCGARRNPLRHESEAAASSRARDHAADRNDPRIPRGPGQAEAGPCCRRGAWRVPAGHRQAQEGRVHRGPSQSDTRRVLLRTALQGQARGCHLLRDGAWGPRPGVPYRQLQPDQLGGEAAQRYARPRVPPVLRHLGSRPQDHRPVPEGRRESPGDQAVARGKVEARDYRGEADHEEEASREEASREEAGGQEACRVASQRRKAVSQEHRRG